MPDVPDPFTLVTASEAALYADVSVQVVLNWRKRGYTQPDSTRAYLPCEQTPAGPRYRLLDVAKAERATRRRARR